MTQLESAFGVVEDGEELFATFVNCSQNNGGKPSTYLTRLHTLLTKVISRGGAPLEDACKLLLHQFCRGCWDQSLIISLQLELKKEELPAFSDHHLMLRIEEDRRSSKYDRMKRHLGTTRAAAHAHSILGMPAYDADPGLTPQHPHRESSE